MAKPTTPIVPGMKLPETIYAKDQKPYIPLPVFRYDDGMVLSRWKLTWKERLLVLLRGDLFLWISTFNKPLQPVSIQIERPKV
jgi:hypothetical protein